MSKLMQRLKEIEARKAVLRGEIEAGAEEVRLGEIKEEAEKLAKEEAEIRSKIQLGEMLQGTTPVAEQPQAEESRAAAFARTGRMSIPMFNKEGRALLVSTGNLVTPTRTATEIAELPTTVCSIVDDVDTIDATGTGAWDFPYRKSDSEADDIDEEGKKIGGTSGEFDHVSVTPGSWGVLDEVSNQVKKMTPVAYAASVQSNAYLALRRKAKKKITDAILASEIAETRYGVALDENFVRDIVLNFGGDEDVAGGAKLYLTKKDLGILGKVRGTQDKKAVYEITFSDDNNGTIKDGGTSVPFSINSSLTPGVQLYGQPKTVKMLLWDKYEVSTDEGGHYFERNMMGIRGLQTAGADLVAYHGMQIIKQEAKPAESHT